MGAEQLIALISALSLAILTPGPSIIATVQTAFAHGRERALPYALGLAVGASLWCIFALMGLAVLFQLNPALYVGFKIFGGFYLLWFAWRLWAASTQPLPQAAGGAKGFAGGIVLNLSNPKPALFYAALILSVFPEPMGLSRQGLIYAICVATEIFWYSTVAVLMSTATMRARYFAAKFWIDRAAALAMAALGLLLILKH
ncbi:Threonine/homoserine/homoserine lactone efflux protein [Paracoccus halophilus]|uniref:Lysine transporter LysE n=1 Tax=Paracoccus halophilus TaxID=376733 RepID=A0A099F412_9RHOB|nr:LysE family translocator [Paracoccus halophilus]KGJ04917.1 lysine transporter LysE [Paracoccus halophilus]SFA39088.1 Threonine/homoserine/homoserine lactone efflux protein [Paracoccus halophilus]